MMTHTSKTGYIRNYLTRCARLGAPLREDTLLAQTGWDDVERTLRREAGCRGYSLRKVRKNGVTRFYLHPRV